MQESEAGQGGTKERHKVAPLVLNFWQKFRGQACKGQEAGAEGTNSPNKGTLVLWPSHLLMTQPCLLPPSQLQIPGDLLHFRLRPCPPVPLLTLDSHLQRLLFSHQPRLLLLSKQPCLLPSLHLHSAALTLQLLFHPNPPLPYPAPSLSPSYP